MTARQFLESFRRPLEVIAGEELAYVLLVVPTGERGEKATAHHVTNLQPAAAARVLGQYAAALLAKPSSKPGP